MNMLAIARTLRDREETMRMYEMQQHGHSQKLAIPGIGQASLEAERSSHFGHCDSYAIVAIEDGEVKAMGPLHRPHP